MNISVAAFRLSDKTRDPVKGGGVASNPSTRKVETEGQTSLVTYVGSKPACLKKIEKRG